MQNIVVSDSTWQCKSVCIYNESSTGLLQNFFFIDVKSCAIFGTVSILTEWELIYVISIYILILLLLFIKVVTSLESYQN